MEPQPGAPAPGNNTNYDFINTPGQEKPGKFALGKDPFITKIAILVGGAVLLMLVVWLIVSLLFGGKTNVETFVTLAQREEEIVRVSELGIDASDQEVRNAAANTGLSITSHQNKLLAYLKTHEREVNPAELALKKDAGTDNKLKQATQTSTFDTALTGIMRSQLETYSDELKAAYNNESGYAQRQMLASQYKQVELLLEQWPD